jgi:MFS family permease
MFLVFAPAGAILPQLPVHLRKIGFSDAELGIACAGQALGSLLAPLLAGQVADRWLRADRWLAACAFCASALLWLLPDCDEPLPFVMTNVAFWLVMAPAVTLTSAICFTHLPHPERDFGRVRLWGTVGWIVQGWLLACWFSRPAWLVPWMAAVDTADIFRLGALMAFLLGLYALTLPATRPQLDATTRLAPLSALRLLRQQSFAVYFLCNVSLCLTLAFASQTTPLFLRSLGVSEVWLGPVLTIAQSTEVLSLGLLPLLLSRWGQRRVMLTGLVAWATALSVLTVGRPLGLVVGSLTLNGLFICCFLVAGQVFVNSRAPGDLRASVQALLSFTSGLGMLGGNLLAGWVRQQAGERFAPTFAVAAAIALTALIVFSAGFNHKASRE